MDVKHDECFFISDSSREVVPALGKRVQGVLCSGKVVGIERKEDKQLGMGYIVYIEYTYKNFNPEGTLDYMGGF